MSIIHDMPDVEYHARHELSSTQARQILERDLEGRERRAGVLREDHARRR